MEAQELKGIEGTYLVLGLWIALRWFQVSGLRSVSWMGHMPSWAGEEPGMYPLRAATCPLAGNGDCRVRMRGWAPHPPLYPPLHLHLQSTVSLVLHSSPLLWFFTLTSSRVASHSCSMSGFFTHPRCDFTRMPSELILHTYRSVPSHSCPCMGSAHPRQ